MKKTYYEKARRLFNIQKLQSNSPEIFEAIDAETVASANFFITWAHFPKSYTFMIFILIKWI